MPRTLRATIWHHVSRGVPIMVCVFATFVLQLGTLPRAYAVPSRDDPAGIAGRWAYRSRSSCSTVEGIGHVTFAWSPITARYEEAGSVYWLDSRTTITWQGLSHYVPTKRRLEGLRYSSGGDQIVGRWTMEGVRPSRLVLRWTQADGCTGVGVATRNAP